jgi:hypothetical protein
MQEADKLGKKLYLYAGPQPQQKANAAVLVSTAAGRSSIKQSKQQTFGCHQGLAVAVPVGMTVVSSTWLVLINRQQQLPISRQATFCEQTSPPQHTGAALHKQHCQHPA